MPCRLCHDMIGCWRSVLSQELNMRARELEEDNLREKVSMSNVNVGRPVNQSHRLLGHSRMRVGRGCRKDTVHEEGKFTNAEAESEDVITTPTSRRPCPDLERARHVSVFIEITD